MACDDCTYARESKTHRRFDLKCVHCGARYLRQLKTWPPKRMLPNKGGRGEHEETPAERQAWRADVLRAWVEFGHDPQVLKDLAGGEAVPFEPVVGRRTRAAEAEAESPKHKATGAA